MLLRDNFLIYFIYYGSSQLQLCFNSSKFVEQLANIYISKYLQMDKQDKLKEGQYKPIFVISAPAKIILCGQHAVVYGQDALAMAISLRCQFTIHQCQISQCEAPLVCEVKQSQDYKQNHPFQFHFKYFDSYIKSDSYIVFQELIRAQNNSIQEYDIGFIYKFCIYATGFEPKSINQQNIALITARIKQIGQRLKQKTYKIEVDSQIPMGKCLGSSASINVCLAASFLQLYGYQNWTNSDKLVEKQKLQSIFNLSLLFEKVQHGTPSGIDNYVTTYGGAIRYKGKKHSQNKPVKEIAATFPFVKLDKNISDRLFQWFTIQLVDTKLPKNTKEAVSIVRNKISTSILHKEYIEQIGKFADIIQQKLQKKQDKQSQGQDIQAFLGIVSRNHYLLRQLGVSNETIENIVTSFTVQHKMAAKITGSGMGGFVLVLVSKKSENSQILEKLKEQFTRTLSASIDERGIAIQKL